MLAIKIFKECISCLVENGFKVERGWGLREPEEREKCTLNFWYPECHEWKLWWLKSYFTAKFNADSPKLCLLKSLRRDGISNFDKEKRRGETYTGESITGSHVSLTCPLFLLPTARGLFQQHFPNMRSPLAFSVYAAGCINWWLMGKAGY